MPRIIILPAGVVVSIRLGKYVELTVNTGNPASVVRTSAASALGMMQAKEQAPFL
jgi:hypothetical protein